MTDQAISSINSLLKEVLREHKHHETLIKSSGDRFNIFSILKLSRKEVRLHSAFIGELLNINGSHGREDLFLRILIQQLKETNSHLEDTLLQFELTKSIVHLEYNMGGISEDGSTGGRIDIRIDDNKKCIIIENKVDARDGDNQLFRYNSIKSKVALIYLTLNGKNPDPKSAKGLVKGKDFVCLSYKEDIVKWLTTCLEQGSLSGNLAATIHQYILLIKMLTSENKLDDMENAIINTLTSTDENIEASFYISQHFEGAKIKRGNEIFKEVSNLLQNGPIEFTTYPNWTSFPYIELYPNNWKHHLIGFTSEKGLFYGIKRIDKNVKPISYDAIGSNVRGTYKTSDWWLCYNYIRGEIFDPESFNPYLQKNHSLVVKTVVEKALELYDIFRGSKDPDLKW